MQEEDVQQFGDNQSDGVKHYLSTLDPEHMSIVVSAAARPAVKRKTTTTTATDIRTVFYAMTDGAIFDLRKCCVIDWFPS